MYNFLRDARTIRNSYLCIHDTLDGYSSDFHVNGQVDGWDMFTNIYLYGCWSGILFGTSYDRSCYIGRTEVFTPIPAEEYYYVKIMMKIADNNRDRTVEGLTTGRIQWTTVVDGVWNASKQMDFEIVADDEWRLYTINMGPAQWWQGNINNLRIYPFLDGRPHDQFAIKFIKIASTAAYACTNTQCSYYPYYSHPCPGAGSRASIEAGEPKRLYTTLSGISDTLLLDIDGYGPVSFNLGENVGLTGVEMARVVSNKISALNVGGYASAVCEHTQFNAMKIYSGVVGGSYDVITQNSDPTPVTWNPLDTHSDISLSEDYFTATKATANTWRSARATLARSSGKFYFEMVVVGQTNNNIMVGIATADASLVQYTGQNVYSWAYYGNTGRKYHNAANTVYGDTYTTGDVISVAVDLDAGSVWFAKNGVWQGSGDPSEGANPAYTSTTISQNSIFPGVGVYASGDSVRLITFRPLLYHNPPDGFSAWDAGTPQQTIVVGGNVSVGGTAAEALGFFDGEEDISIKITGTDPATGFDYASSRILTAIEINRLLDGYTDGDAYIHTPSQYAVEGGRSDFDKIGYGSLISTIRATDYFGSLNNTGSIIIDLSHPINSNGRLTHVYVCGAPLENPKIKILRPHSDGTMSVIHSFIIPRPTGPYKYTKIPIVSRVDCNVLVGKGDFLAVYDFDIYVGRSLKGIPDATFAQISGDIAGRINPGKPYAFGVAGLGIYARGDRLQSNIKLDIDLGDRVNIEKIDIYGQEEGSYFEYNVASCLDVSWDVDLFGLSHDHVGSNINTGLGWTQTHLNIAYGQDCLDDGIITADNGQLGTSYGTSGGNGLWTAGPDGSHSYFYVNGDAEWLFKLICDGSTEFCNPLVPYGTFGFINDPIAFTLKFPYEFPLIIHKSIMHFKDRNNFRGLALSYYLGKYDASGNADNQHYRYIPSYDSVLLDGIVYTPDDGTASSLYLFNNPMDDRVIYEKGDRIPLNWEVKSGAAVTMWNVIEHNFEPIECRGFRIYTNNHESTKITELEVYSRMYATPSLVDNVQVTFSDYGEVWNTGIFTVDGDDKISSFIGGAPRYISLEFDSATAFKLNEIQFLVGDQVKLENCDDNILLEHAKRNATASGTPVVLKNEYGRDLDLIVNLPKDVSNLDDVVFWSKMHSQEDLDKPQIGPPIRLHKSQDLEIGNQNYQCATNVPAYGLKNLVDGKKAYYSYDSGASWDEFGVLSSGVSVDFCQKDPYIKESVLTFNPVSSKYWMLEWDFKDLDLDTHVVYYSDVVVNSTATPIFNKSVYDITRSKYAETTWFKYRPALTLNADVFYNRMQPTAYGSSAYVNNGPYVECVLDEPLFDFSFSSNFLMYRSSAFLMSEIVYRFYDEYDNEIITLRYNDSWASSHNVTQQISDTGVDKLPSYDYKSIYNDNINVNKVSIQRIGSNLIYKLDGVTEYSGAWSVTNITKVRITISRVSVTWGGATRAFATFGDIPESNINRLLIDLSYSDPLDKLMFRHRNNITDSIRIYTSTDRIHYSYWSTLNPSYVNQNIDDYFAIHLEKRHDLSIIRNYGSETNKLWLSTTDSNVSYSNSVTDLVENVVWGNSDYNDARWIRTRHLSGDGVYRYLRKLGIYPDVSSVVCKGGGYNCEWEPVGKVLSDYTPSINVAYGATTTGTNNYVLDWLPDNAVDGVSITNNEFNECWGFEKVGIVDPYLELDFGEPHLIDKVILHHGLDQTTTTYGNRNYTIGVSPTSSGSFTSVLSVTNNSSRKRTHQFDPVTARRLRLTITSYDTQTINVFNIDTFEYVRFAGSFLREIEVYTFVDPGYVDSETWPVVCMNLQDQFNITSHDLINKNIIDTTTDWNNEEEFFNYSDDLFDDPQKVAFSSDGRTVTVYQKSVDSGNLDRRFYDEYMFDTGIYLTKSIYIIEWDARNPLSSTDISLRLEGSHIVDALSSNAGTGVVHQYNTIAIPEDGFYDIKGVLYTEYEGSSASYWGVANPVIYRASGLRKWIAVTRDTATDYAYTNITADKGVDYLSTIRVYGNEEYKPFEYYWWWHSVHSALSNNSLVVKAGLRSLKVVYNGATSIDTLSLLEGDDLSKDVNFDAKNFLCFWLYISSIDDLDTSFGNLKFGAINDSSPVYYQWDISSMNLKTGWNNVRLKFEDADYFYPPMPNYYALKGLVSDELDFRNNNKEFKSFVFTYRGTGNALTMYFDYLRVDRNVFDEDVKFGNGLFLTGFDYAEIPLSSVSMERGAIEFWMKSFYSYNGADIFDRISSRVMFTMVNNNNNILSLGIKSTGWFVPLIGHLKTNLIAFDLGGITLINQLRFAVGDVMHIGFVWNNDGKFLDNGDTFRFYINGVQYVSSKTTWDMGDTKTSLIKFGGPHTQIAYNQDIWGGGIFENIKIYNYCKTDFNFGEEGVEKDITYSVNDFLQVSKDNIIFYNAGSDQLPFVFEQVPNGSSETIYVRSNKTDKFLHSKLTASLIVEWLSSV